MHRPRSMASDCDENNEDSLIESELSHLQRQHRVLQNDYRAYKEETKRVINKQKELMTSLQTEHVELTTCLAKMDTTKNKSMDEQNAATLAQLSSTEKNYQTLITQERQSVQSLDSQISDTEKKIAAQRQKTGGSMTSTSTYIAGRKRRAVLENRLALATVRFNNQLATNQKLRSDIDHLRSERQVFDNLYQKLATKLKSCKQEVANLIELSTQAFDQRDEAQNKMTALSERHEKDKQGHESEMKDLQRIISHDDKIKEFLMIKSSDRAQLKAEELEKKKRRNDPDKAANAEKAAIKLYKDVFKSIQEISGETDLPVGKMVNNFIDLEDENFALFNYVTEQNSETINLQEEVATLKANIEAFKEQGNHLTESHGVMKNKFQAKCEKVTSEVEALQKWTQEMGLLQEKLYQNIHQLFTVLQCDPGPIQNMLGPTQINSKNVMVYIGIIEKKATELLNLEAFMQHKESQLQGQDSFNRKAQVVCPTGSQKSKSFMAIELPSVKEEFLVEEDSGQEELPLSRSELLERVARDLDQKVPKRRGTQVHDKKKKTK